MMTTYTRRGPGQAYLKHVLADKLNRLIEEKDLDLEINPLKVPSVFHVFNCISHDSNISRAAFSVIKGLREDGGRDRAANRCRINPPNHNNVRRSSGR
jgi:GTPase-activator protein for Ras-like GTPase